ncbi:MAG: BrnT family toxin [Gemmatimonadales bacterium]
MRFSWDPVKSDANLLRRGFDFAYAALIFAGWTVDREDTRRDYGERRLTAIGLANGVALTVCYTDRPSADGEIERRIITAWRSNRRERKTYRESLEGRRTP